MLDLPEKNVADYDYGLKYAVDHLNDDLVGNKVRKTGF
jgi:hypothetical protein